MREFWGMLTNEKNNLGDNTPALIGSVAGIITEFIGATFLLVFRYILQQASNNMVVLERINKVGMAVEILNSISEQSKELQDTTKAEIVKLFLSQSDSLPLEDYTEQSSMRSGKRSVGSNSNKKDRSLLEQD